MHARLPKLIDEVLPHEEVQQLSRLGHHHFALCHIVERLIGIKIHENVFNVAPLCSRSGQCSSQQSLAGLGRCSGLQEGKTCH